ncbi:MAG TPA: hypothetical protein PLZ84_02060 [Clostridia bacterium]|nr:hypothetical protein [Clostridia bacterium]
MRTLIKLLILLLLIAAAYYFRQYIIDALEAIWGVILRIVNQIRAAV